MSFNVSFFFGGGCIFTIRLSSFCIYSTFFFLCRKRAHSGSERWLQKLEPIFCRKPRFNPSTTWSLEHQVLSNPWAFLDAFLKQTNKHGKQTHSLLGNQKKILSTKYIFSKALFPTPLRKGEVSPQSRLWMLKCLVPFFLPGCQTGGALHFGSACWIIVGWEW